MIKVLISQGSHALRVPFMDTASTFGFFLTYSDNIIMFGPENKEKVPTNCTKTTRDVYGPRSQLRPPLVVENADVVVKPGLSFSHG